MGKIILEDNWDTTSSWLEIENEIPKRNLYRKIKDFLAKRKGKKESSQKNFYVITPFHYKVKDFLIRRGSGSLLLSGERGAGKTSTVIEVLKKRPVKSSLFTLTLYTLKRSAAMIRKIS